MRKTILITGSTDGIGLATAKKLASLNHNVLLHGRNPLKLKEVEKTISAMSGGHTDSFVSDLSSQESVKDFAKAIVEKYVKLDVLINNAGVYIVPNAITQDGLDVRFAVNTIAPYLLTKLLLPLFEKSGRIINIASAAQFPVEPKALIGQSSLSDDMAYAQSKLALIMWSRDMALSLKDKGPPIIAVNPKSMLGSKMVKQAYGVNGADLNIGADILMRASLLDEFDDASGQYFDNDIGQFASPHPDALNEQKCKEITNVIERILTKSN